jgi:hypothetical protein
MPVSDFRAETCPACGHHVATPFFEGGRQPLATIAWPPSSAEAIALPRFQLDFVRCVGCGHVFNAAFDYADVPYSSKPNLMFNQAAKWSEFLQKTQQDIMFRLGEAPVVVEIGHGDGSFLGALSKLRPQGRYIGFDPHGAAEGAGTVSFRAELFEPSRHLAELEPDLVISRHVLEHLVNPLGFLQGLGFAATAVGAAPLAYFEVPCIDNALRNRRTVDFYYEHSSQFTTNSFVRMLSRASAEILDIGHAYGGEVVFGFVRLGDGPSKSDFATESRAFLADTQASHQTVSEQLAALAESGARVAVWGGTGKSAAFMCRYGVDADRFPLVVDSDRAKVGTFVPGTGQKIQFRDALLSEAVDVVIIPPQWRASDIVREMQSAGIAVQQILVEHLGSLMELERSGIR